MSGNTIVLTLWKRACSVRTYRGEAALLDHTARHLFDSRQRWYEVEGCGGLERFQRLHRAALAHGCLRYKERDELTAREDCRTTLRTAHDEAYAPAYLKAVLEAVGSGRVAQVRSSLEHGREVLRTLTVSSQGVFTVLHPSAGDHVVITSLRPSPTLNDPQDRSLVSQPDRRFYREAVRKVLRRASRITALQEDSWLRIGEREPSGERT